MVTTSPLEIPFEKIKVNTKIKRRKHCFSVCPENGFIRCPTDQVRLGKAASSRAFLKIPKVY